MTNSKPTELDHVLEEYALASEVFDATVLERFIQKFPEHAPALRRYAQVQLTYVQATRDVVEAEELTDEQLLPQQSKLLQRMQQLRSAVSTAEIDAVAKKLATISGEAELMRAAQIVFSSADHGEDLLLVSVTDSKSAVTGVPAWFYDGLGRSIGCPGDVVIQAMAMRRHQPRVGSQRFSTQGKLAEPPPTTWERLVEACISDDKVRKNILERSSRA